MSYCPYLWGLRVRDFCSKPSGKALVDILQGFVSKSIAYKVVSVEEFDGIDSDTLDGKCIFVCVPEIEESKQDTCSIRIKATKPSNQWDLMRYV